MPERDIEKTPSNGRVSLRTLVEETHRDMKMVKEAIYGPSRNQPQLGLLMRVRSLEASKRRQVWWTRTAIGAAAAALAEGIRSFLMSGGTPK